MADVVEHPPLDLSSKERERTQSDHVSGQFYLPFKGIVRFLRLRSQKYSSGGSLAQVGVTAALRIMR